MLWRQLAVLLVLTLSLLLSILALIAGYKRGVLSEVAIATYAYRYNETVLTEHNSSIPYFIYPLGYESGAREYPIQSFFFTVHYLSLCAGWIAGESGDVRYIQPECVSRPIGWDFGTNDPFIVNFAAENGSYPVVSEGVEFGEVHTKGPAATLILGLVFSILAMVVYFYELSGAGTWLELNIAKLSTVLMALAGAALLVSSALVTHTIRGINRPKDPLDLNHTQWSTRYDGWTDRFLGFVWTSVVMMYVSLIGKAWNDVWQKEQRRRMLRNSHV
ncbi:hypothetical protein B0O99DRAFT_638124 [Bisporella sp. PMI_857]|nr:hypothetical protein B0O99DRAFT_638124 [Bisporella sp. PMI_857]